MLFRLYSFIFFKQIFTLFLGLFIQYLFLSCLWTTNTFPSHLPHSQGQGRTSRPVQRSPQGRQRWSSWSWSSSVTELLLCTWCRMSWKDGKLILYLRTRYTQEIIIKFLYNILYYILICRWDYSQKQRQDVCINYGNFMVPIILTLWSAQSLALHTSLFGGC